MKRILCIIYLVFYVVVLYSQSLQPKLSVPVNDSGIRGVDTVYRLVSIDFRNISTIEIPELISIIDSNGYTLTNCYISPYSSNIPTVYIGECAAKYIEKIINPKFRYDRITKNGEYYALTLEDMTIIKGLYEKWWKQKKNNPNYHKSALKGSKYKWKRCPRPSCGLDRYMLSLLQQSEPDSPRSRPCGCRYMLREGMAVEKE
ncbi:MAG: hypothetical protein J5725_12230 [Bacteroidales bacterium]|nr:hypothetical protein [Bacteroidales bacterium]